jgi:RHS repeat-associated protein
MIFDNLGTAYTCDAEERISTTGSGEATKYLYDSEGRLIYENGPSGIQIRRYDVEGQMVSNLAEFSPTGQPFLDIRTYVDGELIGSLQNSSYSWVGKDWLGTKRFESRGKGDVSSGAIYYNPQTYTSLPYGDALSSIGQDPIHFTGKERDAESGNDYFGARYYGSSMGRTLSPDPIGGDMTNPQSLNKYAYALNNPLRFTDPTGLYVCKDGQDCSAFEKSLDALRNSKNADVARAAAAYGALGDKNGVTVGFADLSKQGEDGKVVSTLGTDANGNLQAQSDVTISTKASGAFFDAAIGHEGCHVADAQDVVKSIVVDPKTGDFTVGNNITRYQSEQRAYGVTNSILSSEGVNANEGCMGCDLGRSTMQGQVPSIVDRIMNVSNNYMSGGKHMGPKNQGGSVVNGVDQTPKAAVPQVPH